VAFNFALEKFEKEKLMSKTTASRIKWNPEDSTYTMYDYTKRTVGVLGDKIEKTSRETKFSFDLRKIDSRCLYR
jgi:lipopolysaccharide export system permease protein